MRLPVANISFSCCTSRGACPSQRARELHARSQCVGRISAVEDDRHDEFVTHDRSSKQPLARIDHAVTRAGGSIKKGESRLLRTQCVSKCWEVQTCVEEAVGDHASVDEILKRDPDVCCGIG